MRLWAREGSWLVEEWTDTREEGGGEHGDRGGGGGGCRGDTPTTPPELLRGGGRGGGAGRAVSAKAAVITGVGYTTPPWAGRGTRPAAPRRWTAPRPR